MAEIYNFCFKPLVKRHLPLLLKWLNSPHVQEFWDTGTVWTKEMIDAKYGSYVEGYKLINGKKLPIDAFIIYHNNYPIGYIQVYNAAKFPRYGYDVSEVLQGTPYGDAHLAALDIFIAEADLIGKGIGSSAMKQFLHEIVWHNFDGCLVDPVKINARAIRAYEKAGFVKVTETPDQKMAIMIVTNNK